MNASNKLSPLTAHRRIVRAYRGFDDRDVTPSERFFGESLDAPCSSQATPSQAFFGMSLDQERNAE